MRTRKQSRATRKVVTHGSFFQEQLKGEEALSAATARGLYGEATNFMLERPWEFLADEELILLDDPESGERCYCCVMGAAGEWVGLYVYQGDESYRMFRKLSDGYKPDPYSYYEKQKGVSLEIIRASELESADRLLLKALGHPLKIGMLAPQFRAVRPGYLPWYATEGEGRLLLRCLCAVNVFCDIATDEELEEFWKNKDMFPLVAPGTKKQEYKLEIVYAPAPGPAPLEVCDLDEEKVRHIAAEHKKTGTVLEAEHFFAPGTVGQKNERKMCTQLTIVADANTGFLYHSEFGTAGESRATSVGRALLGAMESGHLVPAEVRVKEIALATGLAGLGSALGFAVQAVKKLPAAQEAKDFFLETFLKGKAGF